MTSILNLFSNFDDLTKTKSINDYASEYKSKKIDLYTPTPALTQGEKFNKYQRRIEKNLEKKIKKMNMLKEGFEGIPLNELNLSQNGLAVQSNNVIQNNNYSSQQQTIDNLRQQYQSTLNEYENLLAKISGSTTGYLNRVNPNNPYLGKNICINGGKACGYVTNQGVFKLYPADNNYTYNATMGKNGCPSTPYEVITGDGDVNVVGSQISSTPPLVVGTPMQAGQSCGNEGSNVFVDKLINNPNPTYEGCYADNTSSPVMTFIGGSPSPPTNLENGNFDQPQISNNSYQYINSNSTVPGWKFANGVLVNSSSAWGFPMPYPSGNQCVSIQMSNSITTNNLNLSQGVTYTLTFVACGRNCCDNSGESNPIYIPLYTSNGSYISTITVVQPPVSKWTNYSFTFTVPTTGSYMIIFAGTWTAGDRSTAFQNIKLNSSGNTANGTYTYQDCESAAISVGYQYFALQDVNTSTSKGYCAVSNSEPSATSLGTGLTPSGMIALWAANKNGASATLSQNGSLCVLDSNNSAIFASDNSSANPGNYLGCYGDNPSRAMPLLNTDGTMSTFWGGSTWNNNYDSAFQYALQNGYQYFSIQAANASGYGQAGFSNDLSQATRYGKASNCSSVGGYYVGGGWSNAIYSTNQTSNYYIILQDDGNMCVYRGTGPNDNQGGIWCTMTNGKQQSANPIYAAANGKTGKNWMSSGTVLMPGEFIGSNNGNMALIMQTDGNLVLYTFSMVTNCQKMNDGNTGGGMGANALYNIGELAIPSNVSELAYIDQNAELHAYPSSNKQGTSTYSLVSPGTNSWGNDIPGAAYGGATVESCQSTCNNISDCAGFVMSGNNTMCWPKTSSFYPNGNIGANSDCNIYYRNQGPINPPIGVLNTVNNIDTITYQKYAKGGPVGNEYGLANATSTQKQELENLQSTMNSLANQISTLTGQFGESSEQATMQTQTNVQGLQDYLQDMKKTDNKIKGFNTNIENILNDSDIVVLQKNYEYLFWSILAAGTVLVTMNLVKK